MSDTTHAELSWPNAQTPYSERFGDVYFDADDGLAESDYVFLQGTGFRDRLETQSSVSVGETGFGTGLNFLLCWQAWRQSKARPFLHFVSVEAFPLKREDLIKAHAAFEPLAPLAKALQDQYPTDQSRFKTLSFEGGRLRLTLMFGLADEMLPQMDGVVDLWFLDGFAPAKNPEMWTDKLFLEVARHSRPQASLSTFTAAGFVRRGLEAEGFAMQKRPGFGRKRECLVGQFEGPQKQDIQPWFIKPKRDYAAQKIAVIGAGIAGCVAALRLQEDGHDVVLFDRNSSAGLEGSGNRVGILQPRVALNLQGGNLFNLESYKHSVDFYDRLQSSGFEVWKGPRGLFQMAQNDEDEERLHKIADRAILGPGQMEWLTAQQAQDKLGIQVTRPGLWFAKSGCLEPAKLCQALAGQVKTRFAFALSSLAKTDGQWLLNGQADLAFDHVVHCGAGDVLQQFGDSDLRVLARRGQVSYIRANAASKALRHPISAEGYFLPHFDGEDHIVGATFDWWEDFQDQSYRDVTQRGHDYNLNIATGLVAGACEDILGGRANMRAVSPDHLPICGPVIDKESYIKHYARLKHGPKYMHYVEADYQDGLYVMTALGSRGLQSAPLMADILASYISGLVGPTARFLREALHPARYLIRDLKKGLL